LPESAIKNLKIDPKVAKQLKEIPDEEIVRLLNETQDGKQLKTLLKETRNIDISEDAARMLKVAKNADEFK
jgi:methyl coenzyme M reductase gamma subunit